jgi:predicted small lipoprotein YifL
MLRLTPVFVAMALVFAALTAGCGPRDPLDLKVSARNADDYNRWMEANRDRLPPGITEEYTKAFSLIRQAAPRGDSRSPDAGIRDGSYYVCQKIHNRSVRQVIIDGYVLANKNLQVEISNELYNAQRNLDYASKPDVSDKIAGDMRKRAEIKMEIVKKMRQQVATNDEMIERFSAAGK